MTELIFQKSFTQQEPISQAGIDRAIAVMKSGKLHRYNTDPDEISETEILESEFAKYQGINYCLACASGGYAIYLALKSVGVSPGDAVITNAFTLAPVPGAIDHAGGNVVLTEIDENYCVDCNHFEQLLKSTGARYFLISHMRGHISDMDAIVSLCERYNTVLIEDCAHTMGASWNEIKSGNFGHIACFSTQTYKHMNSGEGGLLTSNDPNFMSRAILHSGSYMLYERHGARPDAHYFEDICLTSPNYSGRMDNLRAALLNTQLPDLDDNCRRWNQLYNAAQQAFSEIDAVTLAFRDKKERYVGSSFQFRINNLAPQRIPQFLANCKARGVELKWFGAKHPSGFTSRYDSWRYIKEPQTLPNTLRILSNTFDLRLPLTFDINDINLIANIVAQELSAYD